MVLDLAHNVGLLVTLVAGLQVLARRFMARSLLYQCLAGVLFGAVGIVGMMTPLTFAPGVIYDGRSIVLSLAGFAEGPVVAAVAAVICAAYRIYLGGDGTVAGVGVIIEASALGAGMYWLRHRDVRWARPEWLLVFAVVVHVAMMLLQLLIPGVGMAAFRQVGPIVLVIYPVAFVLVAWLFLEGERRRRDDHFLARNEARYRGLFENNHAVMLVIDADTGAVVDANPAAVAWYGWSREELRARHIAEINTLSAQEVRAALRDSQARTRNQFLFKHRRANGSVRDVEVFSGPVAVEGRNLLYAIVHDVTDRVQAERELADSEERLRMLYEHAPVGIFTTDATGRVLSVNAAMAELLGLPTPEAAVAHYTDLGSQLYEHADRRDAFLAELRRKGQVKGFEYEARTADGRKVWLGMDARVVRSDAESDFIIEGFSTDITERKGAEEALAERERQLTTLMSNLPGMAYRCLNNRDWTMLFVSEGALGLTGYSPEALEMNAAVSYGALVHPDDADQVWDEVQAAIYGNRPFLMEYRITHADGKERWVWEQGRAVGMEGDDHLVEGFIVDITERRRAVEELGRLAAALEQAGEAVMVTDRAGTIEYVNPAFERVTGYGRDEVLGRNPRILQSGEHDVAFYAGLWDTITRGDTWQGRIVNRRKDGALYTEEASIAPVRDGAGSIVNFVGVTSDITAQLTLEEQYRQSQKMEAVGQLAGGLAHDFNNILQALLGYTQLLIENAEAAGEPCEELMQIERGAERAAALTRHLLAFSRRQVMRPRTIQLNEVVEELLKMLRRVIGEHIQLDWVPGHDLGAVQGDVGMIEQVLMNLCINARDAMADGGTLSIETQNVRLGEAFCHDHVWARPGRYVLLSVSDTGHGMDSKTLKHVFEPFFTTKEESKGTGLGLATVYGIVKQHEGMVTVYSEVGHGSTFKVYLPVSEQRAEAVGTLIEPAAVGGSETLLLAEDDDMVCRLATTVLERAGYRVLVARDGEEAVAVFHEHADAVDLVILDVVMPRLSGPEALKRIRELRPDTQALFTSGYSENAIHTNFVLHPGLRLLPKPYPTAALLREVRAMLDEQAD